MKRDGAKRRGITERVQFKFVLSFCALLAGLIILLNSYPIAASRDLVASEKESSLLGQAAVISSSLSALSPLEPDSVGQVMDLLELASSSRVLVTDESGFVLYDTGSPSAKGRLAMLAEVALALEGRQVFHSVFSGGAFVSTAAMPVRAGGVTLGAVCVREYDEVQAELILSFQNRLVTISVAASFAALALTVIFSRALTRRITRLAEAIRVVRGGDYAHRLKPEGNDELTELCEEFNNMTQTLETTEQQRRRFVSDASHELKTPLASIRLLTDSILQAEHMDDATAREFLGDIGEEAERLTRITEKLLTLTRLDTAPPVERTAVDVKRVVEKVEHMLAPLARAVEVSLVCDLEEGAWVWATQDDLYQIAFNLMENAVKYNLPGGMVRVTLQGQGDAVVLCVEDTGVGIPEEDLPKIFDRFYRVDKARSRAAGGTGLGLSIVRDTARQHRGTVTVRRREPAGTCFAVTFPRCREKGGEQP